MRTIRYKRADNVGKGGEWGWSRKNRSDIVEVLTDNNSEVHHDGWLSEIVITGVSS